MDDENKAKKSTSVLGFPNYELLWNNDNDADPGKMKGELFPGKWVKDDDCHGLYGQKYPEDYLVRLLNKIDRDAELRKAATKIQEFSPGDLKPMPRTQIQIDACIKHNRKNPRRVVDFDDGLTWWQRLNFMTIEIRSMLDPQMAEEIERGDWKELLTLVPSA
ncbi:MAG: hypothetical protein RL536_274 [Candidatus Parcubacteria bacterium]